MNNNEPSYIPNRIAGTISVIFHPWLLPVYGLAIIFSAPTLYNYIPFQVKKLLIFIVLINNVFLPLALLPFFIHSKIISSWTMYERKDRVIPLTISTILYIVTTYIVYRFNVPHFLKSYIIAVTFLSLVATLLNFVWKISLHSIGAGFLISLVFVLSFRMYTPLLWYIIPSVIVAGLVLSSRLQLNFHNPVQVWGGFLTGIAGFTFFIQLF